MQTNFLSMAHDFKVNQFKTIGAVDGNFIFSKSFHSFINFQLHSTKDVSDNFVQPLIFKLELKLLS